MKRICFIIPYFGHLPNYFNLFLKSCSFNPNFNWLLITDDCSEYNFPPNFKVIYMTFQENQKLIQSKFDFPITLNRAYKLCDYKPAYGYIYEEYIKGYTHWGHCDTDILIGDLSKFLTDDILSNYDKLFCLGHMTIYKNTLDNNRVFMTPINGHQIYKEVFSSSLSFCFDEVWKDDNNVNTLFQLKNKKILLSDYSLNIDFTKTKFIRVIYVGKDKPNNGHGYIYEKYKRYIYTWNRGSIIRYSKEKEQLKQEEYMYIHLQKRKMKLNIECLTSNIIKIVPNAFLPLEETNITLENFNRIKKWTFNNHFWRIHCLPKLKKIRKIISI